MHGLAINLLDWYRDKVSVGNILVAIGKGKSHSLSKQVHLLNGLTFVCRHIVVLEKAQDLPDGKSPGRWGSHATNIVLITVCLADWASLDNIIR